MGNYQENGYAVIKLSTAYVVKFQAGNSRSVSQFSSRELLSNDEMKKRPSITECQLLWYFHFQYTKPLPEIIISSQWARFLHLCPQINFCGWAFLEKSEEKI